MLSCLSTSAGFIVSYPPFSLSMSQLGSGLRYKSGSGIQNHRASSTVTARLHPFSRAKMRGRCHCRRPFTGAGWASRGARQELPGQAIWRDALSCSSSSSSSSLCLPFPSRRAPREGSTKIWLADAPAASTVLRMDGKINGDGNKIRELPSLYLQPKTSTFHPSHHRPPWVSSRLPVARLWLLAAASFARHAVAGPTSQ